jgi:hypothetical protein
LGKICEFSYTQCELYNIDFFFWGKRMKKKLYFEGEKKSCITIFGCGQSGHHPAGSRGTHCIKYFIFLVPLFPNPQQHANNIPPKVSHLVRRVGGGEG